MKKFFAYVLALALFLSCAPYAFAGSTSQMPDLDVGDTVHFGQYEQDNNLNNGSEEIAWIVLERSQDRVLVISENVLDCKAYNDEYAESDWEKCSLRRWLSERFLNEAFDPDEQAYIHTCIVSPDRNPDYSSETGKGTQDKMFLLSIQEINHYFPSDTDRFCIPTSYAAEQGCKTYPGTDAGWWWTRTPGSDNYYATDVRGNGEINTIGGEANRGEIGVRPAMWISLFALSEAKNETMPAWKKAYADVIMKTHHIEEWNPDLDDEDGKLLLCAYSLYDINKDGIPELFLHFGDGEAVEYGRLYTFRDNKAILLTFSRTRQLAGSGDGRWEEAFFPYGWNSFFTYPEGNGVLFVHEHGGKYYTIWSVDGEYAMESDIILSQNSLEKTAPSVVFPGTCALTEFPAYTLMPLMAYENWAQQVVPRREKSKNLNEQEQHFPNNDPCFFEKVISGETPVIPGLIPTLYGRWERFYFSDAMYQTRTHNYQEIESFFGVFETFRYLPDERLEPRPLPAPEERSVFYADLNGDGQLEAICNAQYFGDRDTTFILNEQNGNVYAYGMSFYSVKNIDRNGVVYFFFPERYSYSSVKTIYEGAIKVFFDKESCFFVNVPAENYEGIRGKPEEIEGQEEGQTTVYWIRVF